MTVRERENTKVEVEPFSIEELLLLIHVVNETQFKGQAAPLVNSTLQKLISLHNALSA